MDDAVRLLQQGCDALDIPPAAAKELVRFLLLKKFVGDENGSDLSCSHTLDELWHWMLLETAVCDVVYKLTGKIYHTQATLHQDDFTKRDRRGAPKVRRLATMTAFAQEFPKPILELWQEPDTCMAEIAAVAVKVEGFPDADFQQYVCMGMGTSEVKDLLTDAGYVFEKVIWQPKRKKEKRMVDHIICKPVVVTVLTLAGGKHKVKVPHNNVTVSYLKEQLTRQTGIPTDQQRLIHQGEQLWKRLCDHSVENDSVVHLVLKLRGC